MVGEVLLPMMPVDANLHDVCQNLDCFTCHAEV